MLPQPSFHFVILQRGILHRRLAGHNLNVALWTDLDADHMKTSGDHAFDGFGQVMLTEGGWPAGHDAPPPLAFRRRRMVCGKCVVGLPWCCLEWSICST